MVPNLSLCSTRTRFCLINSSRARNNPIISLRERPLPVIDTIRLDGPNGEKLEFEAEEWAEILGPRVDTFTLRCRGADKVTLTRDADNVGKWWKRYPYADPIVNILCQGASKQFRAGQSHRFLNVFAVRSQSEQPAPQLAQLDERVALLDDAGTVTCAGCGPTTLKLGSDDASVQAEQFALTANSFALRGATALEWRRPLFTASRPVHIEYDCAQGRGRVLCDDAVTITLLGKEPIQLPRGRHDITGPSMTQPALAADLRAAWTQATSAPAVAKTRRQPQGKPLAAAWTFDAAAPVLSVATGDVDGNGSVETAIGCADSTVRLLDANGKPLWAFKTGGQVNSVALGDVDGDGKLDVAAGSDDRKVYVLDATGRKLWDYEGAAGDDPYWRRYWKNGEVEKVVVADLDRDGKAEVLFGAANMHLHCCDPAGKLLLKYRRYGVITSIAVADLTGDGKLEVAAGPARITCYSECAALDATGKRISRFGNDGWASALTAVCAGDLDGDGQPEVVCGTNMSNIYALDAAKGQLAKRWKFVAGDVVTALCCAKLDTGPARTLIAGSDCGYVYALDAKGAKRWGTNLGDGVVQTAAVDRDGDGVEEVVATTADGVLHVLDASGREVAHLDAGAYPTSFVAGRRLVLSTRAGKVLAVE